MKRSYFIKHDQRIRRVLGCDRVTLIFDRLEFYSSRQPNGFYKFIEPNSHKLYKKNDSWTELLGCHRTSFWRAFLLIGKKHSSQWAFEKAGDKFDGKLYASYYDRLTNRMFFIRNHNAVREFYAKIQVGEQPEIESKEKKENNQSYQESNLDNNSVPTEQNARSYIEANNTSNDLSKDKSHAAGDEIIKKMIELWTTLVEEGKRPIDLTNRRIAFLKKAFTDKFDSCLEQWKKYCERIASSRFLMGEIKPFRATLDWVLKFENIQKILEGNFGIGDRNSINAPSRTETYLKNSKIELAVEEEEILNSAREPELIKTFRLCLLNKLGVNSYRGFLKDCQIEVGDEGTLILRPTTRYKAKSIASYWIPSFLAGSPFTRVNIVQQEGNLVFDKWFGDEGDRVRVSQHNEPRKFKADGQSITQSLPETSFANETHGLFNSLRCWV